MNTSPPTNSSFRCTVARIFGHDGHAASCPDCQAYQTAALALETALRRDAFGNRPPFDPRLNDRVVDALRAARQDVRPSRSYTGILSFGGAAVAAMVAAFAFRLWTSPEEVQTELATADVTQLVADAGSLSKRLWQAVEPSAAALADHSPLQEEIESVYSDAQSALSFLAVNFLPSPSESTAQAADRRG